MIHSCASVELTWLAGFIFAGLIRCSALCSPIVMHISTRNIFKQCPSVNWKALESQQLYEICLSMVSFVVCLCVYTPTYSPSNLCCYNVHRTIDLRMYDPFGLHLGQQNQSDPPSALHLYMRLGVNWGTSH